MAGLGKTFDAPTIRAMRAELDRGVSPLRIAHLHGVGVETIRRIKRRETYVGPEWEPLGESSPRTEAPAGAAASLGRLQQLLQAAEEAAPPPFPFEKE